jgi:hypothetical protein
MDVFWIGPAKALHINEGFGAGRIAKRLAILADQTGRNDPPSPRGVSRILKRITEEDWRQYQIARWPESCETAALPWESSAALIELLRHLLSTRQPRPSILLARCYWYVSLARPDLPPSAKLIAAHAVATRYGSPDYRIGARGIERFLVGDWPAPDAEAQVPAWIRAAMLFGPGTDIDEFVPERPGEEEERVTYHEIGLPPTTVQRETQEEVQQ